MDVYFVTILAIFFLIVYNIPMLLKIHYKAGRRKE